MALPRTISLRKSLRLTWAAAVCASFAAAVVLHDRGRARDLRAWEATAFQSVAEAVAASFRPLALSDADELRYACGRAVGIPGLRGAAVFAQDGRLAAHAVADDAVLPDLLGSVDPSIARVVIEATGDRASVPAPTGPAESLRRLELPLGRQPWTDRPFNLVLLFDPSLLGGRASVDLLTFHVPLLGVTGLLFAFGAWRTGRDALRPLRRLVLNLRAGKTALEETDFVHRADEIGAIARCARDLQKEARAARDESARLERSITTRVADETRKIQRDLRRTQREATVDPLTGAWNRRVLESRLSETFHACRSTGTDLALVMIDLDHFKHLNDSLGHAAGDELLAFAGQLIRRSLRSSDVVIRYGGDEFVLLLPGVSAVHAARIVDRMRVLYAQRTRTLRLDPSPSISAGIASLIQNRPADPTQLLCLADRALYASKRAGRDGLSLHTGHVLEGAAPGRAPGGGRRAVASRTSSCPGPRTVVPALAAGAADLTGAPDAAADPAPLAANDG